MAVGATRYFTGVSCPRGHLAERFVSTRACCECARDKKHLWNATNPGKVNAQKRAWVKANPEKAKALKSANQRLNRAAANARTRRYAEKHPDRVHANAAGWAAKNPARVVAKTARYRSMKLQATPGWANHAEIQKVYDLAARFRGLGCDFHVDHQIPLQGRRVCGLHVHNNLHIIEAKANRSKANHF